MEERGDGRFIGAPAQSALLEAANTILSSALTSPAEEELGQVCLDALMRATQSSLGLICDAREDGLLGSIAMSETGWEGCSVDSALDSMGARFKAAGLYGRVFTAGESLIANEPGASEFSTGVPDGHPSVTCFLGVPLRRDDKAVGVIALANRPGGFGAEQLAMAEALEPAVSGALYRLRSEREIREAEASHAFELQLRDAVRGLTDPGDIQRVMCARLGEFLHLDRVVYVEFCDGAKVVRGRWQSSDMEDNPDYHHPRFYADGRVDLSATLVVDDLATDIRFGPEWMSRQSCLDLAAVISVPVCEGDREVGVFGIGSAVPRQWTSSDVALVEQVAQRMGASLERARREAELKEGRERLELALSVAKLGSWDWNLSTDRNVWNAEHFRIAGYEPGEVEPTEPLWRSHIHPDDREIATRAFEDSAQTGVDYLAEYRIIRTDGAERWVRSHGRIERDTEGVPQRAYGVIADVTESRQQEEVLRASERRYRVLHEGIRDGFVEVAMDGHIVDCNAAYREMLGYSAEELRELTYRDLTPMRWHEMEERILETQVLGHGYSEVFEKEYRRKDGQLIPVELRVTLTRDEAGEPATMWATVRDISARKRVEAALKESEAQATELIRYAPTGIYEIAFDPARIIRVNDAMSQLSGYSREELMRMDPFELLDEDSRERFRRRITESLAGRHPDTKVEYQVRHKDGHYMSVVLNIRFTTDSQGRLNSAFVIGHDVSERRLMEDALRASEARHSFLLDLSDQLRPLVVPDDIEAAACRLLAHDLGCDRVFYTEVDPGGSGARVPPDYAAPGIATLEGSYELGIWADSLNLAQSGCSLCISNVHASPILDAGVVAGYDAMQIGSIIAAPKLRHGHLVRILSAACREPREWTPEEVSLVEEVGERTWALVERARAESALQASLNESTRLKDREETLKTIAQIAAESLSPRDLGDHITSVVARLFSAKQAEIRVLNPARRTLESCGVYDPSGFVQTMGDMLVSANMETALTFREGKTRIGEHVGDNVTDESREAASRAGIGAFVVVPISVGDERVGTLHLAWAEPRRFSPEDISFMETVTAQFSTGLQNARLYDAEHNIAETLQETLVVLPARVAGITYSRAYESATYQSGRVGGDFVDVFEIRNNLVGITLGDVSGKGIDAAVTTSLIRTTLRVHGIDGLSPSQAATKANAVMRRFSEVESFVTLWFGVLNTKTGLLRYVSAGHPEALVISGFGELRELESSDPIIGAYDDATFSDHQTVLARGDRLFLYTDGVTEARSPDGQFLQHEGLVDLLECHRAKSTPALAESVMDDVIAFSAGVLRDDAAILAVEATKLASPDEQPQLSFDAE